MKPTTRTLAVANLMAFLGVLVVNFLANALPLHGKNTGELSNQYPNLFTPAGLTFSIWGLIYGWLAVFVGFQTVALFRKSMAERVEPILEKTAWMFVATCLLNMAWIFAWHWEQLMLSVILMLGLLATLLRLNISIGTGHFKANNLEKRIAHWPFGIYQGWITVATIANITALLVGQGWRGGAISEAIWAIGMMVVGTIAALLVLFRQNNLGHGFAVAWALFGIYLQRNSGTETNSSLVAMAAIGLMALVLAFVATRWKRWSAY